MNTNQSRQQLFQTEIDNFIGSYTILHNFPVNIPQKNEQNILIYAFTIHLFFVTLAHGNASVKFKFPRY